MTFKHILPPIPITILCPDVLLKFFTIILDILKSDSQKSFFENVKCYCNAVLKKKNY